MARKARIRNHNEWFRKVDRPKRCPTCHAKAQVWSWLEYVNARARLVQQFCEHCWPAIRAKLNEHAGPCGCMITLQIMNRDKPGWLTLDEPQLELPIVENLERAGIAWWQQANASLLK